MYSAYINNGNQWTQLELTKISYTISFGDINFLENNSYLCMFYTSYNTNAYKVYNGASWINRTLPATIVIKSLAASSSVFMIQSDAGVIYTAESTATTWTTRSNISYYAANCMDYGNNLFATITSATIVKTSGDNGADWISYSLPASETWLALFFSPLHNLFILLPSNKKYFYTTTNFGLFIKDDLPFTNNSSQIGVKGDLIYINNYVSTDLKVWQKSIYASAFLGIVDINGNFPYSLGRKSNPNRFIYTSNLVYGIAEITGYIHNLESSYSSLPFPTNSTNINAFVRTALD
jgi:hypothetical protein